MSRETWTDSQIPATGAESIPYKDNRELVNGALRHVAECFVGRVVGAAAAGGSLLNVPFEPAIIDVSEATGPTLVRQIRATSGNVNLNMITGAANAVLPVVTQVGPNDWTIALPTGLAPDGDTATVVVTGFRAIAGSL